MISGDGWGLSFPDICLKVEENSGKNNQENWPGRGSNPGPLGEKQRCYPLNTAVVKYEWNATQLKLRKLYFTIATPFIDSTVRRYLSVDHCT